MEKMACLLCGDPSATVKVSKRGQPYLRCENCESILFTYSDLGAEMLKAGGVAEAPKADNPPVQAPALADSSAATIIAEIKGLKAEMGALKAKVAEPKALPRKTKPKRERQTAEGYLFS